MVSFGDISITDLNNQKYQKKINIPFDCDYNQGTAYVKVIGTQLGENSNVISTNVDNFGIALYQGEGTTTKLNIGNGLTNESSSIGYPITNGISGSGAGNFIITAKPYKNGDIEASSFMATANISISYY